MREAIAILIAMSILSCWDDSCWDCTDWYINGEYTQVCEVVECTNEFNN